MRRLVLALAAVAAVAAALPAAAAYYEIDPLTREPLQPYAAQQLDQGFRPQASAIPRERVGAPGNYAPGTIVINTSERRLYVFYGVGTAFRYGVGVGRPGFSWAGTRAFRMTGVWPDWRPPAQMLKRRPDLPPHMKGGLDNPLGARALYLGGSLYRIHGSNEPESIGQAVSSGCIRMTNEDVIDLYERTRVGTRVVVQR
jgi:lipoprotein-anchoring transpeptidase ErfK/SrfK